MNKHLHSSLLACPVFSFVVEQSSPDLRAYKFAISFRKPLPAADGYALWIIIAGGMSRGRTTCLDADIDLRRRRTPIAELLASVVTGSASGRDLLTCYRTTETGKSH
jgi:hypothetical protein